MSNRYFINHLVLIICILMSVSTSAFALEPTIEVPYDLISKTRISRTVYEYTFKATLVNSDSPIKLVRANATSHSSFTTVIDGELSFNDMEAGATAESSDTFIIQQDRLEPFGEESLSWEVVYEPDISTDLEVGGIIDPIRTMSMREGKRGTLGIDYRFSTKDRSGPTFTLRLNQTVEPATGLTFSQDLNNTVLVDEDSDGIINTDTRQIITAQEPGDYTITTTATVVETGKIVSAVSKIKVYAHEEPFVSLNLGMLGDRILPVGHSVSIPVQVTLGNEDKGLVTEVEIQQIESGESVVLTATNSKTLNLAFSTRTISTDTYYAGEISIDTSQADRCFTYIALAETSKGVVQSFSKDIFCVTSFPIGFIHPPEENLWSALISEVFYANNLLLLEIEDGTSESRIREIVSSVNATVVGVSRSGYRISYQIQLLDPPTKLEGLENVAQTLQQFTEVLRIEVYAKGGGILSLDDDPLYLEGAQPHLELTRADEAWYVTGMVEAPTIAVVDTGVDFAHPDLRSKLFQGINVVPPLSDTAQDTESHGSHVAGIIAASSNNGIGVAGVSRNSNIYPVRAGEDRKPFYADISKGIKRAVEAEVKIINASLGVPGDTGLIGELWCGVVYWNRPEPCKLEAAVESICNTVQLANNEGAIVVAAAGNDGEDIQYFPAACSGAISVGATNETGTAALSDSNFGDWVHLAAPGKDIMSIRDGGVSPLSGNIFCREDGFLGEQYDCKSGTSQAAPQVSAALAVLLARHPEWKENAVGMEKARKRLIDSAKALPGEELGEGQVDVFEAVFNGNFELVKENAGEAPAEASQLEEWQRDGFTDYNCNPFPYHYDFGIKPTKGSSMLACHNGGSYRFNESIESVGSAIWNLIDIPDSVEELPLSFSWKVLSSDLDGVSFYDDRVFIELVRKDDFSKRSILFATSLNNIQRDGRTLTPVQGLNGFLQTDWQHDSYSHPIEHGPGEYYLRISVLDIGDAAGDTMFLVDDIHFTERFTEEF